MHQPADNLSSFSWQAIKMSSQPLLNPSQESDSPKNLKLPSRVSVLTIASALATLVLFSAILIDAFAMPFADYMILALTATMIINAYVFISLMELRLAAPLMGLKSSTLLWLSVAGLVIWVSHNDALGNVNEIFGVDPALLPLTVSASTFMHVMIRLKNPCIAITCILLIFALASYVAARWRKKFPHFGLSLFAKAIGFMLILSMIIYVIEPDRRRNQILYHIAHQGDFKYKSPCSNYSLDAAILYLDPMREKILIAPKLVEQEPTTLLTHPLLARIASPEEFKHDICKYN
ncbi:hypothetical protein PPUTLS46_008914 [Pseudomonas putida LS46]|nr:hypothetical protein PPUTLS46_008914 [Pseudomonas putida LS46]